jgi:superfamily II DNA/RNA helicase
LSILDPILQFLTRATGQTLVPFGNLETTLPTLSKVVPCEDFKRIVRFGILRVEVLTKRVEGDAPLQGDNENDKEQQEPNPDWEELLTKHWDSKGSSSCSQPPPLLHIGFPSGDANKKLCGSTKTAAKRRLAALRRCLKDEAKSKRQSKKVSSKNRRQGAKSIAEETREGNPGNCCETKNDNDIVTEPEDNKNQPPNKDWTLPSANDVGETHAEEPLLKTERDARKAFQDVLGLFYDRGSSTQTVDSRTKKQSRDDLYAPVSSSSSSFAPTPITSSILPKQLSYAGTQAAQTAEYEDFFHQEPTNSAKSVVHPLVAKAFGLVSERNRVNQTPRKLYRHQAQAITSALGEDRHTLVCTGTGSGKSLCFLVPVLQRALTHGQKSLLLFPTKALAQDQLVKLQGLLDAHPELAEHVSAAALDGDTPHSQRALIAETCNVIFTNPDTLHASILPNWETKYKALLCDLKYVVVDEAHMYEGVFGAHVAMILARLYRIHCVCAGIVNNGDNGGYDSDCSYSVGEGAEEGCANERHFQCREDGASSDSSFDHRWQQEQSSRPSLVFLACSATLAHPEHHFRLLCCIPSAQPITVLTEDFSPRAAKHFFVWNPPLLDENGKSLGYVAWPKKKKKKTKTKGSKEEKENEQSITPNYENQCIPVKLSSVPTEEQEKNQIPFRRKEVRRRHSADETALLLARAVKKGVRCIAFCKTRCLVEWVYERCIKALKQSKETASLISKVDCYRGGYSKLKRREIEEKLFHNQLLGVVGTSALELGVDIGGVGLTLHCGFPSSHASLMQQAGRAGRGAAASHTPSLAICVCFNSPIDQHLWRHPTSLLSRGLSAPLSMPIYPGLVQGHLIW